MSKAKAVILLSGGLDSTTTLAIAKSMGFDCYALSFDYGQKQKSELIAAKKIANNFKVSQHYIMKIPLADFANSALTDKNIDIPNFKKTNEIPVTYVPARNTIFLSFAIAWAEVIKSQDIFIGVNSIDYSSYPDCRKEYIKAFNNMANLATKEAINGAKISIITPLIDLNKVQIIKKGISLGVDYSLTISCYQADENGKACGICDACGYRKIGFKSAKIKDPTRYK
jgi:7-cyano-7-deazaguanine synthase